MDIKHLNEDNKEKPQKQPKITFKDIKWNRVAWLTSIHLLGIYGFLTFPYIGRLRTVIWALFVMNYTIFGVTAGIHRFWTHKAFKANTILRVILAFCFLTNCQLKFFTWVKYHRIHHKYSDTNSDPHNSKRGFFFSHMGWFMVKMLPDVKEKLEEVDLNDLKADQVIVFAEKHYAILVIITQLITVVVPVYFWDELLFFAAIIQIMRWVCVFHLTASVNSISHLYGHKPYDKNIEATDNILGYITMGEGWHNYHHVFPYDYRVSEVIGGMKFDATSLMIRLFYEIGWAYDLKQASNSVIKMTIDKRGNANEFKTTFKPPFNLRPIRNSFK